VVADGDGWRFCDDIEGASSTWALTAGLLGVHHPDDPECFFVGVSSPMSGWNTPHSASLREVELKAKFSYLQTQTNFTYSLLVGEVEPGVEGYTLVESSSLTEDDRMSYFRENVLCVSKSVYGAISESPLTTLDEVSA